MKRSLFGRLLTAFFLAILILWPPAVPTAAENYTGKTVVVYRKGKPPMTGTVLKDDGKTIRLKLGTGIEVEIVISETEKIVVKKPPQEEFKERAAKCKTAKDWLELAKWCASPDANLPDEERQCYQTIIDKVDPENAEARAALGFVKRDGKWVNEEEEKKAQGFVKRDGKYIKKEEADRLDAEKRGITKGKKKRLLESEGRPWADSEIIKTQHYIVKCNSTPEVAKRYSRVMESLNKAYSEVLKDFEPLYTDPGLIFVFRNREEFLDFTLQHRGVGGFFSHLDKAVRTYHGSFALTGNTDMILAHEATHQFQHRIMKNFQAAPLWLIEGMATYFGDGSRVRPDKVTLHMIPRDRLQTLQEAISGGHYVLLKDLLRSGRGMNFMACYDHGWGFIFWCLQGNNPKYKFGHKGEGKRVWDRYLKHVATELPWPPPNDHFDREGKLVMDLILKETGAASIEKWEEEYKKFIQNLPLYPLGTWSGMLWDGFKEVGIKLTFPERMKKVDERELRQPYREAAAATTADGLRLWITVLESAEQEAGMVLKGLVGSLFTEVTYDSSFHEGDDEPVINTYNAIDMAEVKFEGKFSRRRETAVDQAAGEKAAKKEAPKKGSGKSSKKDEGGSRVAKLPDPTVLHNVRAALLTTEDRVYVVFLAGPKEPFSKMEPQFETVLNSIRLNYELQATR